MKRSALFLLWAGLFLVNPALADTVILKSGKVIEGKILEENDAYLKIDSQGSPLFFERKYIKEIIKFREPAVDRGEPESAALPSEGEEETLAETFLKAGLKYASEGEFAQAKEEFKKGRVIDPFDKNIEGALSLIDELQGGAVSQEHAQYLFKGSFALMSEDYPEAVESLKKAIELYPNDLDSRYNLGVAYYYLNDFTNAVVNLEYVFSADSQDAQAAGLLGNAYYMLGDMAKAKQYFQTAKELFQQSMDYKSASDIEKLINELLG